MSQAAARDAALPTLEGFDASIWVESIPWAALAADGRFGFAFIEAARGVQTGPHFSNVWRARDPRVVCGPYQRLFSTCTGPAQVGAFIAAFEDVQLADSDLPPVIDVEYDVDSHQDSTMTPAEFMELMDFWIDAIAKKFERRPVLYTGPYFWRDYLQDTAKYSTLPLWIADTSAKPTVPSAWSTYTFWQYAEEKQLPGVSKSVDLDRFNGDAQALQSLIERSIL